MYKIFRERPADAGDIEQLLDLAFGPNRLAKASYQYRDGVDPVSALSWIARDGERLVGTLRYWADPGRQGGDAALLLGPLAVDPTRRGEGIGRMLVARTIDQATLRRPPAGAAGRRSRLLRAVRLRSGSALRLQHAQGKAGAAVGAALGARRACRRQRGHQTLEVGSRPWPEPPAARGYRPTGGLAPVRSPRRRSAISHRLFSRCGP
jgi:GNAT superfamily N-acetyltransferase